MTHSHPRTHLIVAVLVAVVIAAVAAACSAQVSVGASGGGTPGPDTAATPAPAEATAPAGARGAASADMTRILEALGYMQAVKPDRPVVVLLGGSAARESTISDAGWRKQIVAGGGPATLAWNMGGGNRTMAQNVALVKALPKDAEVVVLVGINLGAFTSSQRSASISLPSPLPTKAPSLQQPHRYGTSKTGILSPARKKTLLKNWVRDRYPVFRRNFTSSSAVLETLIKVCQTRGYKPVLFELPRNTAIVGSTLNAPTKKFRGKCRALAKKYGIPWVSLVATAKIPNSGFYDLWHLVEPGRKVWQRLLSKQTVSLLKKYGYDGGS
jgi:hypothetical protein